MTTEEKTTLNECILILQRILKTQRETELDELLELSKQTAREIETMKNILKDEEE